MMEQQTTQIPVTLTRDDYIRSQELLMKTGGARRLQLFGTVMGLLLAVFLIVALVVDGIKNGGMRNMPLLIAILLAVAANIAVTLTAPWTARRRCGEDYDNTLFTGYSFNGILRSDGTTVSKETQNGTVSVTLDNCPLFVEAADMMIFCTVQGKSLVVPARCLTAQDADILRAHAFAGVPRVRRRLLAKLQPQLTEPLVLPENAEEDALYTVYVDMTKSEMTAMVTDAALDDLVAALPTRAMWASAVALGGYFFLALHPVLLFVLGLLLFTLVPLLTVSFKVGRAVRLTDGDVLKPTVTFTNLAVHLRGEGPNGKVVRVPWEHITRAVDCRDRVELYAHRKLISIPKRNIRDMERLRQVVDAHYQKGER